MLDEQAQQNNALHVMSGAAHQAYQEYGACLGLPAPVLASPQWQLFLNQLSLCQPNLSCPVSCAPPPP